MCVCDWGNSHFRAFEQSNEFLSWTEEVVVLRRGRESIVNVSGLW